MDIQLKDEHTTLTLTNEENDNDNFITIHIGSLPAPERLTIDVDILELYSAVLSFVTLKKKKEERDEHYAKRESLRN